MPLFYKHNVNKNTNLAIWKIEEDESFFLKHIRLHHPIQHPKKRLQHLAGRFLISVLNPQLPLDEIKIASSRKPFLPGDSFYFSISHCASFAAAIVSTTHRVGIDAETVSPKLAIVKHRFLSASEWQFASKTPPVWHLTMLSVLWCAKEAVYKWYGQGEVDFRNMIQIQPFCYRPDTEQFNLFASFTKLNTTWQLLLHCKVFNGTTAVWVATAST